MEELSRRNFMKTAAVGAAALSATGLLAACSAPKTEAKPEAKTENAVPEGMGTVPILSPTKTFDSTTGHNFGIAPESKTVVGTT